MKVLIGSIFFFFLRTHSIETSEKTYGNKVEKEIKLFTLKVFVCVC